MDPYANAPNRYIIKKYDTTPELVKYGYEWNLRNFPCKQTGTLNLPSIFFNVPTETGTSRISLNISGNCGERKCSLNIPNDLSSITCAKLWIKNETEPVSALNGPQSMNLQKLLRRTNSLRDVRTICILCDSECTIMCEITLCRYVTNKTPILQDKQPNNTQADKTPNLRSDLALFEDKKYCDVTFLVSGKKLPAHKCILSSRNKVFAAMFEHDMEEAKSGQVPIDDIDSEVFEDLLRFIYTGEVLHLKEFCAQLLAASEKYDVQLLKSMCINELFENISIESAIETFLLADLYSLDELKDLAVNFINANREKVANTDRWENFISNYPKLLAKLYVGN